MSKIFGLGMGRTGTVSLNRALIYLGRNSIHHPNMVRAFGGTKISVKNFRRSYMGQWDAFTDSPVLQMMHLIPDIYPEAKYIVTSRDLRLWLQSCIHYFKFKNVPSSRSTRNNRMAIYMSHKPAKKSTLRKAYKCWYKRIFDFVKDRDHVVVDCGDSSEEKWTNICKLLGITDVPTTVEYPHANQRVNR